MTFDQASIVAEIKNIIGDLAEQYTSETDELSIIVELQNTLRWLTSNNVFNWNVDEAEFSHTSGVITLPTNLSRILMMSDSGGNTGYYYGSYEDYYLTSRHSDLQTTYSSDLPIPFIIFTNKTTGLDELRISLRGGSILTTRTFYIVYSILTDTLDAWIPERIRPFLVSFTAANMLIKVDSPDRELIQYHTAVAKDSLTSEINFGKNRSTIRFNTNLTLSPNLMNKVGGEMNL